ncbi:MAG: hypothetical protein AAF491_06490, partial [Verrucomicrobiota bacterium]
EKSIRFIGVVSGEATLFYTPNHCKVKAHPPYLYGSLREGVCPRKHADPPDSIRDAIFSLESILPSRTLAG